MSGYTNTLSEVQGKLATSRFSFHQILIVFIGMLIAMVDGYDGIAISMAAHQIGADWSIAPDILGYVLSAEMAGILLGTVFLSALSDKYGRRRIMLPSIALVMFATLATAYTSSTLELVAARVLTGLGIGGVLTSLTPLVSEFTPLKYRVAAVTMVTTGAALGSLVASVISDYSLTHLGWQSIFVIGASMGVVVLLLSYFFIPESVEFLASKNVDPAKPEENTHHLERINNTLVRIGVEPVATLVAESSVKTNSSSFLELWSPDYRKATLTMWAIFFSTLWGLYIISKWFPKLLIDGGYDQSTAVYSLTVLMFGGINGALLVSLLSTRFQVKHITSALLFISCLTICTFIIVRPESVPGLYLFVFILGVGVSGSATAIYNLPMSIYPTRLRARGFGFCLTIGRVGAIISPIATGYLVVANWNMADLLQFVMLPAFLVAATLLLFVKQPHFKGMGMRQTRKIDR